MIQFGAKTPSFRGNVFNENNFINIELSDYNEILIC